MLDETPQALCASSPSRGCLLYTSSPVDKVRREYAIYLDHCQRHGVTILRGDTSLDLTGRALR